MNDSDKKNSENDWPQYKLMIVDRLEKAEQSQKEMGLELQTLQSKVTTYEFSGGAVVCAVLVVLTYLKFHGMLKNNESPTPQ